MSTGPTTELSKLNEQIDVSGISSLFGGAPAWQMFMDTMEYVPDLVWPRSIPMFTRMRTDSQLAALCKTTFLPVTRYRWMIDPNGARAAATRNIASDLNLPRKDTDPGPRPRQKNRFSFHSHLQHVLLAPIYGHMFFQQVGDIHDDGLWHLKKLQPIMPWTVGDIFVAEDGGLVSITQNIGYPPPEIPVDHLTAYVWDKEGANWVGRSIMRDCYKNYLIKDRLLRIDAVNHAKAGGIPHIEAQEGATPAEMEKLAEMAKQQRVGEESGGAIPYGARLRMERATGSDVVNSIRWHDQAMARAFMLMVIELGISDTGSRALSRTFMELAQAAQENVAIWFRDIFNEHVLEDYVDYNWENEEYAPLLTYQRNEEELSIDELATAVEKGIIVMDEDLEDYVRGRGGLPDRMALEEGVLAIQRRRVRESREPRGAAGPGALPPVPARPLARQPYDHEVRAAVDFSVMENVFLSELQLLLNEWNFVQEAQIQELHDQIVAAGGNLNKLTDLNATPQGAPTVYSRMVNMAQYGARSATTEAQLQGVLDARLPDVQPLIDRLELRAAAVESLMAQSLSDSARRRAVNLTGGDLSAKNVAAAVRDHLQALSGSFLEDQFGGVLMQAQNSGRKLVFQEQDPVRIYASELLDHNTCEHCRHKDGTEYQSVEAAEADYPTGGYKLCDGGMRCRGTLVAVYDEAPAMF